MNLSLQEMAGPKASKDGHQIMRLSKIDEEDFVEQRCRPSSVMPADCGWSHGSSDFVDPS